MRKYRTHIKRLIVTTAAIIISLTALTAWIDPFSDFSYLSARPGKSPLSGNHFAERKYKSALIRGRPANSIEWGVFGNSRATAIDISKGVPGHEGAGVNFAFGGARLGQIKEFVRTAKARHPAMRPIIATNFGHCLGKKTDDFLYLGSRTESESQRDAFYRLFSLRTLIFGLWAIANPQAYSEKEMKPGGHFIRHLDATDEDKIMARIKIDVGIYRRGFKNQPYKARCVDDLRQIKREYPDTIIIINPLSRWMLDLLDETGRAEDRVFWLNSLKEIGPILDFSCARSITDNWKNYADGHHYRGSVSKLILEEISRSLDGQPLQLACQIGP